MTQIHATLRLQFHREFTFSDAVKSLDYFAKLGVSHLYASPITTAQPGSMHGYDTVDYTRVNPELGGEDGLRVLVAGLRQRGMGLIIDIVPNHMGVGGAHNAWWRDILEWGRRAQHARYFDVDWHSPDPALRGKVLAPFLGESFGEALAGNKITLVFDSSDGRYNIAYFDHRFPISPPDYAVILGKSTLPELKALAEQFGSLDTQSEDQLAAVAHRRTLADFAQKTATQDGTLSESITAEDTGPIAELLQHFDTKKPQGVDNLQRLLDRQHYRLAWWRSAADEVNWRRFFDISSLAGMRVERGEVFDASHALVLRLYAEGLIDGVRVDHVDGLAEPREYCQRLRARLEHAHGLRPTPQAKNPDARPYLVVEKILARDEAMRTDWAIDGTTGYDFMNDVGALLHDAEGAEPLALLWETISGRPAAFRDEALPARRKMLAENLVAELDRASRAVHRIARDNPSTRDYSFTAIKRVLTELAVHYPVYRIYPMGTRRTADDERYFSLAREGARKTLRRADHGLLDQIDEWFGRPSAGAPGAAALGQAPGLVAGSHEESKEVHDAKPSDGKDILEPRDSGVTGVTGVTLRRIALTLFSQLSSPVAAKSVEDTACYRYGRLISRNEVGADPDDFSLSPDAFHQINISRQKNFPLAMLNTATHDHKRGEDVRARLAVLSEIPEQWGSTLRSWAALNAPHAHGGPGAGPEAMLYQTLLGCWPPELQTNDAKGVLALAERVAAWQEKALREAKLQTDWFAPDEAYESASRLFLMDILSEQRRAGFLAALKGFVDVLAPAGVINSLQQTLLRLTAPGIPDLYQGTERWDWSLVDPDNRRPVDYPLHARLLASIEDALPDDVLSNWQDGRIKQRVVHRALALRKAAPALFLQGDYLPLQVTGQHARSILAFARRHEGQWMIVVVTRLAAQLLGLDEILSGASNGTLNNTGNTGTPIQPLVSPERWADTSIVFPEDCAAELAKPAYDWISGQVHATLPAIGALLNQLPVALLSNVAPKFHS